VPVNSDVSARSKIVDAAYELFSSQGIRAVPIDAILERSGVARKTLYRHFGSKDALVLEFLRERESRWTQAWLQGEVEQRASDPGDRLLAIFDVFDGWFRLEDFEGCSFINVMLEFADSDEPAVAASVEHLANIREFLQALARDARIADPDNFARQWHILMKGSIIAAGEGDENAALRAREIGRALLAAAPRER
jgi:AcrR family transcriptional regulator